MPRPKGSEKCKGWLERHDVSKNKTYTYYRFRQWDENGTTFTTRAIPVSEHVADEIRRNDWTIAETLEYLDSI